MLPLLGVLIVIHFGGTFAHALEPTDFAIQAFAQVNANPPQIRLQWRPGSFAAGYTVSRKLLTDQSWNQIASLPQGATSFVDYNIVTGAAYEYEIAHRGPGGIGAYGYVYAGVNVSFPGARGRVVLVVDNTVASALANELARLVTDLVGDGWSVRRHDVSRDTAPWDVRSLIRGDYYSDPNNTRAVLLIGHVPVPYSGDINPDLHAAHVGAWPADAFYGDMDGDWTDGAVYDTSAEDARNHNVPGDGKFDQSQLPARVVLAVGRIDMFGLDAFAPRSEVDLLRQYLNKNHDYRHRNFAVERRGLIRDNFGEISGDAPATDAWRSFAPMFGPENIKEVGPGDFFPTLAWETYAFAYGGGGGEYYQADGVGSTTDFANQSPRCVFYMLDGSYFGDWDTPDNLLRAALASPGNGLAAAWTGLPHWFMHHMALGETIGYSTLLAQNNRDLYKNQVNLGAGQVHIALMGDPTLRLHVVAPPGNLTANALENGAIALNWRPSPDAVYGYYVYRSDSPAGPFSRLTRSFLTTSSYTDTAAPGGAKVYMVRAVKLESSPSGTYYNPSQGIFASVGGGGSGPVYPVVRIQASNDASEVGPVEGAFVLSRSEPFNADLTVTFGIGGSGQNGVDYEWIGSQVFIPAGQDSAWISIHPVPDNLVEGPETVTLTLQAGGPYTVGSPGSATIVIQDQHVNQPPDLSPLSNLNLLQNAAAQSLPFTVSDPDTSADALLVSASSSNLILVPQSNLALGGSGGNRVLTITPARDQLGTATITVNVSDGVAVTSRSFTINVAPAGQIGSISTQPGLGVVVLFSGTAGRTYVVQVSKDLLTWANADSGVFGSAGTARFIDGQAQGPACRFYRVQWE